MTASKPGLNEAFDFTPDDLAALRLRLLAPEHQRRLRQSAIGAYQALAVRLALTVALTLAASAWMYGPEALPLVAGIFVVCLIPIGYFNWHTARGEFAAIARGQIGVMDASAGVRPYRRGTRFGFIHDHGHVDVDRRAQAALVAGQRYRVYILEGTATILGVEALADSRT